MIKEAITNGLLIPTWEIPPSKWPSEVTDCVYLIEHKIPYISYPYEWTFNHLKLAALHHLNFQIMLLKQNLILKDANAYNIQFIGTKPIFMDYMSIAPYKAGEF